VPKINLENADFLVLRRIRTKMVIVDRGLQRAEFLGNVMKAPDAHRNGWIAKVPP
jgi:hypothetical protein